MRTLPSALARLCNRLACERMKAATWGLGEQIRAEYKLRLRRGEPLDALENEVQRLMVNAMSKQVVRSIRESQSRTSVGWRSASQPLKP